MEANIMDALNQVAWACPAPPEVANAWSQEAMLAGGNRLVHYLNGHKWITTLPLGLECKDGLYLSNCLGLERLPAGLRVGMTLDLMGCEPLKALPQGLWVGGDLDMEGCEALTSIPGDIHVACGMNFSNCTALIRCVLVFLTCFAVFSVQISKESRSGGTCRKGDA